MRLPHGVIFWYSKEQSAFSCQQSAKNRGVFDADKVVFLKADRSKVSPPTRRRPIQMAGEAGKKNLNSPP
jgi:hypothetical protein